MRIVDLPATERPRERLAALAAAFELARRTDRRDEPVTIASSADIASATAPLLRGRDRERLVVVSCDSSHRVVACDVVSEGAMDRSLVPVREVIVAVLRRDGRAFALAHNHPSGDPTPSGSDEDTTRRVTDAAQAVGLRFLDHIIVTDTSWRRVQS